MRTVRNWRRLFALELGANTLDANNAKQVGDLRGEKAKDSIASIAEQRLERGTGGLGVEERLELLVSAISGGQGDESALADAPTRNRRLGHKHNTGPSKNLGSRHGHNPLGPALGEPLINEPVLDHGLVELDKRATQNLVHETTLAVCDEHSPGVEVENRVVLAAIIPSTVARVGERPNVDVSFAVSVGLLDELLD